LPLAGSGTKKALSHDQQEVHKTTRAERTVAQMDEQQAAAIVAALKSGLCLGRPGQPRSASWRFDPAAVAVPATEGEESPSVLAFRGPEGTRLDEAAFLALLTGEDLPVAQEDAERLAAQPQLSMGAHAAAAATGLAVGDVVELEVVGGGSWTRCVIAHIVAPEVTIAVEFPPVPDKEFQGAPVAYFVEQTAGVGEKISVPKNSLRSVGAGDTPRSEDGTVVAALSGAPMLRLCSPALSDYPMEMQPAEWVPADSKRVRRYADGLPLPSGSLASALKADGVLLTVSPGASAEAILEAVEKAAEGSVNLPVTGIGTEADAAGRLPLHLAVIAEDTKVVSALLQMDAAVDGREAGYGETALHLAAVQGTADIAYALLNAGADPLCPDHKGGWTPIHASARADTTTVLEVLLEAAEPCNIDVRSSSGDTALHRASLWGCHNAVKMLLESGADPHAKNSSGLTPKDVICAQPCAPSRHRREIEASFASA
jgi:hypothetical protein